MTIVILFICTALIPDAKSQISVQAQLGYALPWAENDVPDGSITVKSSNVQEIDLYKKSFGAGQYYTFSLSYPVVPNFSLGLQFSYLSGAKTSLTVDFSPNYSVETYSGRMLWVTPQILMEKPFRHLTAYVGIGPSVGLSGKIIKEFKDGNQSNVYESKGISSKGMAYGVSSKLGVAYFIGKKKQMKLLAEIQLISASYAPRRSDLVKLNKNGTDILGSLTVSERAVVYKKNQITDQTVTPDPNQPSVATIRYYAFSSVGINIGIAYLLFAGKE